MIDYLVEKVDDIWTIFKGEEPLGRVISQRDGNAIIDELHRCRSADLRDRIIRAVTDAIEDEFDQEAG